MPASRRPARDYAEARLFLHGSTIAINTILERTGAKTALLITKGFRDIYEIGRINRPDAYNLFFQKHVPLVERALRFEVKERMLADGEIDARSTKRRSPRSAPSSTELGIEAVAILFLHCYRNPDSRGARQAHPRGEPSEHVRLGLARAVAGISRVRALLDRRRQRLYRAEGAALSRRDRRSHPRRRLRRLVPGRAVDRRALRRDAGEAHCIRMLESGPAAGVIGTQALCRTLGLDNAIAFDMGGTTAKAGVIHKGEPLTTGAALIGGYEQALPIQIAMMDIFEVGTGGGSIARVEDGTLRVGPQSAGAQPGPACYGRGGNEPTVTDANLVLGRLARRPLPRRRDAARSRGGEGARCRPMSPSPLGMDVTAAADGILRIAVTAMSYAVKGVTTERGLDAGDFALVAYGGAGPLHAVAVAREIGIRASSSPPRRACSRPSACCSPTCATISCAPGSTRLEDADFDDDRAHLSRARGRRPPRHRRNLGRPAQGDGRSAPPTCAMSARSMPSPSICR